MPIVGVDPHNKQGGKAYGQFMEKWGKELDSINQEFLEDDAYKEEEELAEKLEAYKKKFIECDGDYSGDLDEMDVKRLMERLGQAKTHLEIKKMIGEVDTTGTGVITYRDFLSMMLGKKNSVLKLILMYEEMAKSKTDTPKGPPPKKTLASLP